MSNPRNNNYSGSFDENAANATLVTVGTQTADNLTATAAASPFKKDETYRKVRYKENLRDEEFAIPEKLKPAFNYWVHASEEKKQHNREIAQNFLACLVSGNIEQAQQILQNSQPLFWRAITNFDDRTINDIWGVPSHKALMGMFARYMPPSLLTVYADMQDDRRDRIEADQRVLQKDYFLQKMAYATRKVGLANTQLDNKHIAALWQNYAARTIDTTNIFDWYMDTKEHQNALNVARTANDDIIAKRSEKAEEMLDIAKNKASFAKIQKERSKEFFRRNARKCKAVYDELNQNENNTNNIWEYFASWVIIPIKVVKAFNKIYKNFPPPQPT